MYLALLFLIWSFEYFFFGPKQCFYLTHSAWEYFEKLLFKTNKKRNFKRLYLKGWGKFRITTKIFRKFIQLFLKQGVCLDALPTWVQSRRLQPLVIPPAARRVERLNNDQAKVLHLLFFIYFFCKWGEILEKVQFFSFGRQQQFYITHSFREYFEKLSFKRNKKLNFKRLYLKN